MRPQGDCIWMIGDNPVTDIKGAREKINSTTLQKIHDGVNVGAGSCEADVTFNEFHELRNLIKKISG